MAAMTELPPLTNIELAALIREHYGLGEVPKHYLLEAENRGVKLTVTLNRITINLREGGVDEGPSRTIDKHPLDVAAGLEEL